MKEKFIVDEKDSFYSVDEESIAMAETAMQIKFPSELIRFYKEIGYGFLKTDYGNINRIMDPISVVDFRLLREPYAGDPEAVFYKDYDIDKLVFFEMDSSLYFSIELGNDNEQGIYMLDEKIADSLSSFIEKFRENELYMLQ